ncbi:MAG: TnsA-like heteromeric transposase endonuclease subunit [Phycicoccus sp.]
MPSVGLRPVGAQVGAATWLFRCRGAGRAAWSWGDGPPDVRGLEPVRGTRSGRLSKNIPVQAMSVTTGGWLFLESGLEHELATWLDRQRDVAWLLGQPLVLEWEDGTSHVPDLLSEHRDGTVTIWDAKLLEHRDETFAVMTARTKAACDAVGWRYDLFGGLAPVESLNLRWIASARRPPEWLERARVILREVLGGSAGTVGDVLEADDWRGFLVSAMWHLVWTGELEMDLSSAWDSNSRLVWAPAETTS